MGLCFEMNCVGQQDAYAAGGEYGILEGRIFSLIHPVVMLGLFTATGYAGYLGWQWRRVRTIQDEINELKKQVPAVAAEGQAVPSPVDGQIKELSEVCKFIRNRRQVFDLLLAYFEALEMPQFVIANFFKVWSDMVPFHVPEIL